MDAAHGDEPGGTSVRVGKALGYDVRREVDRIDVSYYGAEDVCYVAIEHERRPVIIFPKVQRKRGGSMSSVCLPGSRPYRFEFL